MRLIDADKLKKEILKWLPSDPCGIAEKEYPAETDIVVSLMMEIEEAPTIEQPTWTPCNERLPSKDGRYLAFGEIGIVPDHADLPNRIPSIEIALYTTEFNMWFGMEKVYAWMPLPKP